MGTITLVILLAVEAFFLGWAIKSHKDHTQEKSIVRIAAFAALIVLLVTGVFEWGFRYYLVLAILAVQAAIGAVVLFRKTEKPYKLSRSVRRAIGCVLLYSFTLSIAIIFPQYKLPVVTGGYEIATARYTWIDEDRIETFSSTGENRALTVEFWYPQNIDGKAPLVVFSHGAFGFSGSNESTFIELASHGYVVASIGHTYHAFVTVDTNGNMTFADMDFINSVYYINDSNDPQQEYYGTRDWLNLRIADGHFVLDTIIANVNAANVSDPLFSIIDLERIGVFGHSLGGALSAQLGRERGDIDAVINLDGSMLGDAIGFENGKEILNETPYPIPLLTVYSEYFYRLAMELVGEDYLNFYANRNAVNAVEIIFTNAGHLNFTDLPLFSPLLARMLGIGTVDARYCIGKTNDIVLEFFDCYLKGGKAPDFEREY